MYLIVLWEETWEYVGLTHVTLRPYTMTCMCTLVYCMCDKPTEAYFTLTP